MGVLIFCPEGIKEEVQEAIGREAASGWDREEQIRLFAIPDMHRLDAPFVTGRVLKSLPRDAGLNHVVAIGLEIDSDKLSGKAYLLRVRGMRTFKRRTLPQTLKSLGLDWLSQLGSMLSNSWHHGDVDRDYLEKWIRQFDRWGSYGWVASGLLRILDFFSDSRIRGALRITQEGLTDFDCVCVNRHMRAGKSADAIASLAQKQLDAGRYDGLRPNVLDLRDALQSSDVKNILFVEDCLITGNEMVRIFTGLLGREDSYGEPKAEPLSNPDLLREKRITLRFTVVTNGGLAYITSYLKQEGLTNVSLDLEGVEVIETLTPQALEHIEADSLFDVDDCIIDPDRHIVRASFRRLEIWKETERANRAMSFCAKVGRQLYERYVEKRGKNMSERKLDESALGMRGLALALAFSHSVPKETLPLFWMGGTILCHGKPFEWEPLFQSGE